MTHYFWLSKLKNTPNVAKQHEQWSDVGAAHFSSGGATDWHLAMPLMSNSMDDDPEHDSDVDVLVAPPQIKRPPQYAVIILNDDYTPMEFVIEVLQDYFAMDIDRATQVMLNVHHQGRGVAGIYPRDIAETKANQVNQYARSQGHPLLCQIEPQQ